MIEDICFAPWHPRNLPCTLCVRCWLPETDPAEESKLEVGSDLAPHEHVNPAARSAQECRRKGEREARGELEQRRRRGRVSRPGARSGPCEQLDEGE